MASDPPSTSSTAPEPGEPAQVPPSDRDEDTSTRIIRRAPLNTGMNTGSRAAAAEPQTTILRRHPTGALPALSEPVTQAVRHPEPVPGPPPADPTSAIATTVASIVAGWATGVIATDLITGWWATDPLFCVAMGFLAAVSAAASISGVIALLLRRRTARLLIVVGAVIALLIFAGLFVAGAALPGPVYALPLLPAAAIALAALPGTARWSRAD
ncbi:MULTISPECIES: hypothetical protein [Mycolicibacterium]|uniref:Transmembrane protein n=2 Tax=Mycolicibacterium gilvum TaxID=1804 RepID=E6THZ6_MYCSR|nr:MULTISPECIES: hypothetical protein [Mycolicibacterium]ABP44343.1 hypothetical protein Mflv_1863 [Mycolicibacterium gilvum PYR-GCK]ADT97943.1 hypothetical protein Mspyr1_12630 [Mycolicibacterium gilvum Spyr1]MBV5244307.1 hypothetical protein [Mycolicibacterium sp. PAM1]